MVVRTNKDKSAAEKSYVLGIDIDGTHFRIGAVALQAPNVGYMENLPVESV